MATRPRHVVSNLIFALLTALTPIPLAMGQAVQKNSFDLSGNGGVSNLNGLDNKRGHASFGFTVSYNLSRHIAVQADYNYLTLGSVSPGFPNNGADVTGHENLQEFGAASRLGLVNTKYVVPYVVVGVGGVRAYVTTSSPNSSPGSSSKAGGYIALGTGASFYLTRHLGLRPEIRYDRFEFATSSASDTSSGNALQATGSIFYQFGGRPKKN